MWRHVVDVEALQACGWAGWEAECATKVPPELVPQPWRSWPGSGFPDAGLILLGQWGSGRGQDVIGSRVQVPILVCRASSSHPLPLFAALEALCLLLEEDKVQPWGGRKLFRGEQRAPACGSCLPNPPPLPGVVWGIPGPCGGRAPGAE